MQTTIFITYFALLGSASSYNHYSNRNQTNSLINNCRNNYKHNYYEGLINNLNQEVWDPDQKVCRGKILNLIESVQNFTLWAVWIWDSMSSNPVGNMMGSRYHSGNFDQCLMKTSWTQYKTQYCLTEVNLHSKTYRKTEDNYILKGASSLSFSPYEKADKLINTQFGIQIAMNELYWGVCLPVECSKQSVEIFTKGLLKSSYLGFMDPSTEINVPIVNCQTEHNGAIYKFYIFCFCAFAVFVFALVSDIYVKNTNTTTNTLDYKIAKSFSLAENYRNLMKPQESSLNSVCSIRVLSSFFIVLLHISAIAYALHSNSLEHDEKFIKYYAFMRLDLAVDAFYCLSGLFLMKSLMTKSPNNPTDLSIQVLKRYFRLLPSIIIVMLFQNSTSEMRHGPYAKKMITTEIDNCNKNWWVNLLMIVNLYDVQNMCLPISWYVSSDFQMFLCTVLLFYLYKKCYIGNYTLGIVGLATILTPGFVSHWHGFNPIPIYSQRNIIGKIGDKFLMEMYIPTYNRAGSYIVGLITGYFISLYKLPDSKGLLNKRQSIIGVAASFGLISFIQWRGAQYFENHGIVEEFLYTCLHRPLFAVAIAILIICCSYGDIPIIKTILNHNFFVPLSKLTYGVYLLHIFALGRFFLISRNPVYVDEFIFVLVTLGVLVMTYSISLILYLLVEAPMSNLFEVIVSPNKAAREANNNRGGLKKSEIK